ncbi:branched-chain amino acid ABC transporter permease [Oricola cellulosilytica]|uniref:Branched-chain amino acid ABC transporter permease n=1 Tax=Oricola cellulosilytica TaxID=1429082 RepID=A0A4R0PIX8_9HYPH|nr:branched-chain amino acid ABC transporter permease [Oricola cellulosilytica]TCD16673.1 branched-chain amino acid ABC transporter permease [Oricola cellulosilytica]
MDILQLLVSGLANGCIYGLIALGFVLIYKATEAINFAQGDMMMLGAFITLGLTNTGYMDLPFWIAVPLAIALMGVFGYLLDLIVIRRMFGEAQIAVVILTIALGFVMRFAAGTIFGHEPQSLETPYAGQDLRFGGVVLGVDEAVVVIATVALTVVLFLFFNRTKLGVAMQASSQNQLAAYYMGIPVRRVQSLIWGLAGVTATIAGVLYASKGSIDPSAGLLGIKAFAAAVIGGMGSLPGALLGGIIVGVIEPFASRYVAAGYSQIAPYLLLFLVLVFRPHGILAQVHRKKV